MNFDLDRSLQVLARTPHTVRALIDGLDDAWIRATEGPDTFSPFDVVGHLIDGDETDWMARVRVILAGGPDPRFHPFDRFRHKARNAGRSLTSLVDEFSTLRADNLEELRRLALTPAHLDKTGIHPVFGVVTLRQLLATWTVHDLDHLAQISRVMAKQYGDAVGPWSQFLSVLRDREKRAHAFAHLAETYETERLKTLTVWSQFQNEDFAFRPEPRARSVHEHLVHQCLSEDAWFTKMLGMPVSVPALPSDETKLGFIERYAAASAERLQQLRAQPDAWFSEPTTFFTVTRSRAWVLTRRIAHSAHHRGQLTTSLRLLGRDLYSTYGPTADTGGLPANGASVIYRYESVEDLLGAERAGGKTKTLPGTGEKPVTERPRT